MGKVIYLNEYRKDKLEVIEQRRVSVEEQYNIAFVEVIKEYGSLEEYYKQLYK